MYSSSVFGAGTGPSVGEPEGGEEIQYELGLAAAPGVAHVGQGFKEPGEENLEGAGDAARSSAASRAAHSGPGFRKVIRSRRS